MDEEETAGFSEPCSQCSEVNWRISDEGRFYCHSCHTAIERTRDVVDLDFSQGSSRISNVSRGPRTKKQDHGVSWSWCEGFQFILQQQAEALIRLGVTSDFRDSTLWPLWTLYLQRSGQAFNDAPSRPSNQGAKSDSDGEEACQFYSVGGSSVPESGCDWSDWSGSFSPWRRRSHSEVMTMCKTLALIHVCVLWNRECVTLSHLLKLVRGGHVPFLRASELLPDRMKFVGKKALMFNVKSFPSHRSVLLDAQHLVHFLQLPVFPPISREHPLHLMTLTLCYLMDANLPDQLHQWVCRVEDLSQQGSASSTLKDKGSAPFPPPYDLQAAALIIVTMKLLFGLDDHTEWDLSNNLEDQSADVFSLRRWYRIVHCALLRAQNREEELTARRHWKPTVPMARTDKERHLVLKRKRISEQVQSCFHRLSSPPCNLVTSDGPSIFSFCWGDGASSDGPSLHHQTLTHTHTHPVYWHRPLQPCNVRRCTGGHFLSDEASLPRSFLWLLQLFSFLLRVSTAELHQETLKLERRVFGCRTPSQGGTDALQEPQRKKKVIDLHNKSL
ncbi:TATA box-binding protein-associated factor RNA polymerase I subunit B [Gouania willdenowi]|uniref:TATA box-binding protein-associated factor RNA polymerase I subunit B n=1 Tax=Gouania willdenowi TaxID=441366 RepID=A0A8C5GXZ5_GOUWI|nr:TATA box-binding protein-associated factor RNA polymerase I subunit B [Gouania willdenowi]